VALLRDGARRSAARRSDRSAEYEAFFRALAEAWAGPYDRERTPEAVGPVFERFGMRLCTA